MPFQLYHPQESPHDCKVHSCVTVNIENEHGYGQLQPMGWQNPLTNLSASKDATADEFYEQFFKRKLPYLVRNHTKIPDIYQDDQSLKIYAGNWSVIVEEQNRIIHDHREPFRTDWNFSQFLSEYRSSPYYLITPKLPACMHIDYPSEFSGCKVLQHAIGEHRIWMSDGNTSSSLHFDTHDVFIHQIDGIKEIFLWDPTIAPATYMDFHTRYGLSPINTDRVDKIRFPEFSKYHPFFIALFPGDMLYIPTLWWHQLRSPPGRNIMYAQEFELEISIPHYEATSKIATYWHVYKQSVSRIPSTCNDKFTNSRIQTSDVMSTQMNTHSNKCMDFCVNPCSDLNGNYQSECSTCSKNYACNPTEWS